MSWYISEYTDNVQIVCARAYICVCVYVWILNITLNYTGVLQAKLVSFYSYSKNRLKLMV